MFGLGFQELLICGAVAVILFGKRLPEVARSLGASYQDFRRGLADIQSQMDLSDSIYRSNPAGTLPPQYDTQEFEDLDQPTAPKLELPGSDEPAS